MKIELLHCLSDTSINALLRVYRSFGRTFFRHWIYKLEDELLRRMRDEDSQRDLGELDLSPDRPSSRLDIN